MELNEIKGIHNLPYGENPFHHNFHNSSFMEKSLPISIQTKMMKEREEGEDYQNELEHHNLHINKLIFPSTKSELIITQAQATNDLSPNTSCYSNDTVLEQGQELSNIVAERKLRRMISNRESARRSRMRKKKQIEELQYQVSQLEDSNRHLSEKVIQLLECNEQILHENAELKHKASSLQILLTNFLTPLRSNLEDVFNSTHHLPS